MKRVERDKVEENKATKKEKKRGLTNKVERLKMKDSRTDLPKKVEIA